MDGTTVSRLMEELLRSCGLDGRLRVLVVAGDELGLGKSMVNDDVGGPFEGEEEEEEDEEEVKEEEEEEEEEGEEGRCSDIDDEATSVCTEATLQQQQQQQHQQQQQQHQHQQQQQHQQNHHQQNHHQQHQQQQQQKEEEEVNVITGPRKSHKKLLQCRWQRCLVVMQKSNNNSSSRNTESGSESQCHRLPTILSSVSSHSFSVVGRRSDEGSEVNKKEEVMSDDVQTPPPTIATTMTMDHKKLVNDTVLDLMFTAARRGDTATLDRIAASDLSGVLGVSLARCPVDSTPPDPHASSPGPSASPSPTSPDPSAIEESIWDMADAHDCRLLM